MPETANKDELTAAQRRTLAALLVARNPVEAAQVAKVSERSVWRWLKEPTFAAALRDMERNAIEQATRRLTNGTATALDVILAVMQDEDAAPGPRLRAATAWLDYHLRYRELTDFADRLAALEERMEGMGK